jgi:hypothetical protein
MEGEKCKITSLGDDKIHRYVQTLQMSEMLDYVNGRHSLDALPGRFNYIM